MDVNFRFLVFLFLSLTIFGELAFASDNKASLVYQPVLTIKEVTISENVQRFIAVHTLVNPQPVFIKELNSDLYRPLNGIIFRNVVSKKADEIVEFSKNSKSFSGVSIFLETTSEGYKNIFVGNGVILKEICAAPIFFQVQLNCLWKQANLNISE